MEKFNLNELAFDEPWSAEEIATVENFALRAAEFDGEFPWHKHDNEDEMFIVFKGKIKLRTREKEFVLNEGEGMTVPKGVEHSPISVAPSIVLMFEPKKLKTKIDD